MFLDCWAWFKNLFSRRRRIRVQPIIIPSPDELNRIRQHIAMEVPSTPLPPNAGFITPPQQEYAQCNGILIPPDAPTHARELRQRRVHF